jgi:hypothetical protein
MEKEEEKTYDLQLTIQEIAHVCWVLDRFNKGIMDSGLRISDFDYKILNKFLNVSKPK